MRRIHAEVAFLAALIVITGVGSARATDTDGYRGPDAIDQSMQELARSHRGVAEYRVLATSPGGRTVPLLRLGKDASGRPAVLVIANMEGNCPPASEAAIALAEHLVGEWQEELEARTWYLVPMGNPDGHARFWAQPQDDRFVNDRPVNDDNDDATDEDGPDDLNGDGLITMMRQAHPEGRWVPVEGNPVLMKKAEREKGEVGIYRLFPEGIDNDGDGEYNEDAPGGANPGWNFPHNFEHYRSENGRWAASEVESRAVLEFAFEHPEIAMVITLGRSNSLREVPEGSGKAQAAQDRYKVPERWARQMGIDPEKEFPIAELVEMAREFTGYQELTEDMVLQWLGAGAALKPDRGDVPYWKEISEKYGEFLKERGLDGERLDPPGFADGCVEEWAYYQLGVPSFSMDFWTVPIEKEEPAEAQEGELTPDAIEKMSNDEFIALGEEKIAAFLKAQEAPPQYSAAMVIGALRGGMMDTKKMAEFLRKAEKKKEAGGADETEQALYDWDSTMFLTWEPFEHPALGPVEIGGMVPWVKLAPPNALIDSLIEGQLPFLRELVGMLPRLAIQDVQLERRADGVWQVHAWVANTGYLPLPTHQGERCKRPTPAVAEITGEGAWEVLEGRARRVLGLLDGSAGNEKVSWLIKAADGSRITLSASQASVERVERVVTLTEGGTR